MFKLIEGLPPDVIGIEATGKVTHEDYKMVFFPKMEAMITDRPVKLLYVAGKGFEGYELEALWDDAAFGVKHWRDISRVAVVADQTWLRAAVTAFKPFFPCEVRLFKLANLDVATSWIAGAEKCEPPTPPR
jgi:hypothetical protein